ncbi:hypothetical protein CSOJ01_08810 [Colletotrichum sojae]|uniref:Uncharacterized protein n=1 Tax=Colletotrichum sojae TaxID=2175907 RepID=A0A8H6MRH7_9PEZI|nr:hypothetical protein CSOJ01_08810 [Colletotrichum sojae]
MTFKQPPSRPTDGPDLCCRVTCDGRATRDLGAQAQSLILPAMSNKESMLRTCREQFPLGAPRIVSPRPPIAVAVAPSDSAPGCARLERLTTNPSRDPPVLVGSVDVDTTTTATTTKKTEQQQQPKEDPPLAQTSSFGPPPLSCILCWVRWCHGAVRGERNQPWRLLEVYWAVARRDSPPRDMRNRNPGISNPGTTGTKCSFAVPQHQQQQQQQQQQQRPQD